MQSLSNLAKFLTDIKLDGNIIPLQWFKVIGKKNRYGQFKADLLAINIMAELVYWYRPVSERDEVTGEHSGYRMKFAGDKYQFAYRHAKEKFGASKKSVKNSCDLLVKLEAATREFRSTTVNRVVYNNVMYMEPCLEWVKANTLPPKKVIASHPKKKQATPQKVGTNTETTSETSKDIKKIADKPPALLRRLTDLIGEAHKHLTGETLTWEGKGKAYGQAMKSIIKIVEDLPDDEHRYKVVRQKCGAFVAACGSDEFLRKQGVTPLSILGSWNKVHYKKTGSTSEFGAEVKHFPDYRSMSLEQIEMAFTNWTSAFGLDVVKKNIEPVSFSRFMDRDDGNQFAPNLPRILDRENREREHKKSA